MKLNKKIKLLFLTIAALPLAVQAQSSRITLDLSKNNWSLWLDTAARWENDKLYPPPVNIGALPVNIPTGGWGVLYSGTAKNVHLPATVEEYYWGQNGNPFGVAGNYLGVSWFSSKIFVPQTYRGKHISLQFESVRLRAEVFVNHKFVGYDLVNGTPFEVDISSAVKVGAVNDIAVRITDPNGNFDWRDSQNFMWGDYRIQPSHGFGGITGKVKLAATDDIYINDIFVENKPQIRQVVIEATGINNTAGKVSGKFVFSIKDNKTGLNVFSQQLEASLEPGNSIHKINANVPNAKLWDVDHPNLYTVSVTWRGANGTTDNYSRRFGFRWFEIRDVNGDQQFYLNNKRIVLRTSISWGFWPVNGIAPTDELALKQVQDAKRLGLNMLNFHRGIGQRNVLDAADELGLLYFEEPGGNQYPENLFEPKNEEARMQTGFYFAVRNEKLFRMVKRDRSHPSLIIYNMHNERGASPHAADSAEMTAAHALDPSRILTYNSSNGNIKMNEPDPHFKLHLLPYDDKFYSYGWFDQHHAGGPGVYHDNLYSDPEHYAKYTDHKNEIVYFGEEGAIGTPPRLQLIRNEILKHGKNIGWETDTYLKWYDAYNDFLIKNNFLSSFANVDSLTRKMGNVAYYYQGRIIENVRINNIIDGYAVNGWESMKLEDHSGVVDNYRNLKGDPDLIARYNKPLYLAVKLNHKVLAVGDTTVADIFIVNEEDLKGDLILEVVLQGPDKKEIYLKKEIVKVAGGQTYGQLLLRGIKIPVSFAGYSHIKARLIRNGIDCCIGSDDVFAIKPDIDGIDKDLVVADTTETLKAFLRSAGVNFKSYTSGRPDGHTMIVNAFEPPQNGNPLVTDILEWVNNGNKLVIVGNTEKWAAFLSKKEVVEYRGAQVLGTSWYGGNFFVKASALFKGLPQSCVFNWEYQCLAAYNKNRYGLRIVNGETIVGCVSDHKQEIYSALSIIPLGRGKIILTTLDLVSCIKDIRIGKRIEGDGENASMSTFNVQAANPSNIVGQQLLFNLLKK
ncbi:MAG TPA: glycoside hydrolase family 2 TIM barrel-domain containing protein [Mucilaginibacter sp.]